MASKNAQDGRDQLDPRTAEALRLPQDELIRTLRGQTLESDFPQTEALPEVELITNTPGRGLVAREPLLGQIVATPSIAPAWPKVRRASNCTPMNDCLAKKWTCPVLPWVNCYTEGIGWDHES